jgi:hypothetical protein
MAQPIVVIDEEEVIMIGDDSEDEIEILEYGELPAFNFPSSFAAMSVGVTFIENVLLKLH